MNQYLFVQTVYDIIARNYIKQYPSLKYGIAKTFAENNFNGLALELWKEFDKKGQHMEDISKLLKEVPRPKFQKSERELKWGI